MENRCCIRQIDINDLINSHFCSVECVIEWEKQGGEY